MDGHIIHILVISSVDVFFLCCDFFPWRGRGLVCVWFELFLPAILLGWLQQPRKSAELCDKECVSAILSVRYMMFKT